MDDLEPKFVIREEPIPCSLSVTPAGVYTLTWNEQTIEMKNIEEAKTVALYLFRGLFEVMNQPTLEWGGRQ